MMNARRMRPAMAASILVGGVAMCPAAPTWSDPPLNPAVMNDLNTMINEISPQRLKRDVESLAGFGTRHTLSDTESNTRGIGAARRWLKAEFERIAAASGREGEDAIRVEFDAHMVEADDRRIHRDVEVVNVIATIPGACEIARARHYYILAHYDSRASDPNDAESDAPGANDDASGVAVLLELARVMSTRRFDSTIVLMATAGEEQGLYGARMHARAARERGVDIRGVLNNDTVGDPSGPGGREARGEIRVFSEGLPPSPGANETRMIRALAAESDSPSRQLARHIAEIADLHDAPVKPRLIFRHDRFLRGGDHTAFNEQGWPGIRFVEVYEDYNRQHQDVRVENGVRYGDTPDFVDGAYLADVTRLNALVLAYLANAPSTPADARIIAAEVSNDTTLRWSASSEPGVAGYEVVWRETTSPVWRDARDVGNVTEATIELSKDNWFFGVRAYDREGRRSPVAFPVAARE